jgi:malonyl-CoA/methylmalonyl-CoA synthetase
LANPKLTAERVKSMRLFVSGSAPLLPETFTSFKDRTGHAILERYGMTETGMNTSNPLEGERKVGTVGFPLPGIELRIADDQGHPLPDGEVGVIEVKGPNVLKGYWNNPDKTRDAFRPDGFFITGDVAYRGKDGYVAIVGRASDMIISGGYNVYPKEIETIIDTLPGIAESAVIGVPHPDFGEGVVAVIRRQPGKTPPPEAEIITTLKGQLAGFKVPKKLVFVDELPRNAMGKVVKAELRKGHAGLFKQ